MSKVRTAVLISGRGSNMMALVEASRAKDNPTEIVAVLSNKPDAAGLAWAADKGIRSIVLSHRDFKDRAAFENEISRRLAGAGVELIALAGFLRVLGPEFVTTWEGRLINIHPSLLPAYKGLDTHERVLAAGDRETGCSVHFVTPELDGGPVIAQARVPVLPGYTADTLAARVLAAEHRLYPEALAKVASGRVVLRDGRVVETGTP